MEKREYKSYKNYIEHQLEKNQALSWDFKKKVDLFKKRFSIIKNYSLGKVLCLGARFGEEVVAFESLGFEAIGLDILPRAKNVLKGDFNNLPFEMGSFDGVYTNSLDHAYDLDLIFKNVYRVLKSGGYFFMDVQFHNRLGQYESYFISSSDVDDLISKLCNYFEFIKKVTGLARLYKSHKDVQLIFQKVEK